jgi:hypothetical protein
VWPLESKCYYRYPDRLKEKEKANTCTIVHVNIIVIHLFLNHTSFDIDHKCIRKDVDILTAKGSPFSGVGFPLVISETSSKFKEPVSHDNSWSPSKWSRTSITSELPDLSNRRDKPSCLKNVCVFLFAYYLIETLHTI